MYFLILIVLLFIIIPVSYERNYQFILYLKIFVSSIIYFYFLINFDNSILSLLFSLIAFATIIQLIYRIFKISMSERKEDNMLFKLAHEVKNPLAVCKGYLDMLDINDPKKNEKYLLIIKTEMDRSLTIMNEFLDLKRINLKKDLMDFSLLIDDIKETLDFVLKDNNIKFVTNGIKDELIINGDYDKLKQVLINLIKNSYEAGAKNIELDIKENRNNLKLKIIDDGKGISKENLKNIGKIFYTTKAYGTGVGVNMAKEIIKLHDGSLTYESIINKGTVATIILPLKYVF